MQDVPKDTMLLQNYKFYLYFKCFEKKKMKKTSTHRRFRKNEDICSVKGIDENNYHHNSCHYRINRYYYILLFVVFIEKSPDAHAQGDLSSFTFKMIYIYDTTGFSIRSPEPKSFANLLSPALILSIWACLGSRRAVTYCLRTDGLIPIYLAAAVTSRG